MGNLLAVISRAKPSFGQAQDQQAKIAFTSCKTSLPPPLSPYSAHFPLQLLVSSSRNSARSKSAFREISLGRSSVLLLLFPVSAELLLGAPQRWCAGGVLHVLVLRKKEQRIRFMNKVTPLASFQDRTMIRSDRSKA